MGKKDRVWFEQAAGFLNPGLVQELKDHRELEADKSEKTLPVIIRFNREVEEHRHDDALHLCNDGECNYMEGKFDFINGAFGCLSPEKIRSLVDHDGVDKVYYDYKVQALLDVATKSMGAIEVQTQSGLTGEGVTIAIIDTGIHPHDDVMKPTPRIKAFVDMVNKQKEPYDDQGHGTHCAGDAVGNGHLSEGLYIGPAPKADLIGIKVLDAKGSGQLSTVIRGVEWCIKNKKKHGIRVISLSLGAPAMESYMEDLLCQAVEKAWHHGIVVCAAAGNEGPYPMTISTPGIDPLILTVGSADDKNTSEWKDDVKASYSSRGPTRDFLVKPDIYAPGTNIISLLAPGSALEKQLPENLVGEHYLSLSGTSMATPMSAGVVALLLEANPHLSPNDVKAILMDTARLFKGDQAGYIDVVAAVKLAKQYAEFQGATVEV
ncbi:S8 family peptidase [Marininema halotolerans]|uniref:Serine protease AprX n=1 Tax=Marininema halotolerans TaxID=1155944 RepID=A0A1I6NQL5_9BACL|nr:S8 family peptidase [Marininema halotolerans]SFS30184.1 serine protease AprX [Marininema halotolerans]